jgi:hypothetical protein
MLGDPEAWLEELALMNLEPEDGCLQIVDKLGPDREESNSVTAFTEAGIEALRETVAEVKQGQRRTLSSRLGC